MVGGRDLVMKVIKRVAEHYDVQQVEFGRSYRWCPECVVLECDCGKRMSLKRLEIVGSGVICECGAELSARICEEVVIELLDEDAAIHPWDYDTQAQTDQHLRDEAAYPENSPWRYNDVTSGLMNDDEQRWEKAKEEHLWHSSSAH
jgi:hypothetical protein